MIRLRTHFPDNLHEFIVSQPLFWHDFYEKKIFSTHNCRFSIESNYFDEFCKSSVLHRFSSPNSRCFLIFQCFSWSWKQFFDLYSNWETASLLLGTEMFSKNVEENKKARILRVPASQGTSNVLKLWRTLQECLRSESFSRQIRNLFGEFRLKSSFSFDYLDAKNSQQISEEFVDLKSFFKIFFFEWREPLETVSLAGRKMLKSRRKYYDCFSPLGRAPEPRV